MLVKQRVLARPSQKERERLGHRHFSEQATFALLGGSYPGTRFALPL
jgi:hypothetical protein